MHTVCAQCTHRKYLRHAHSTCTYHSHTPHTTNKKHAHNKQQTTHQAGLRLVKRIPPSVVSILGMRMTVCARVAQVKARLAARLSATLL
mmetsp:Transcript_41659/g.69315  ORF Transcript_41659/g.69315 Transcript_41659/m.69315 type:complete len:89 (-) Transcript_41659:1006-1272(-)